MYPQIYLGQIPATASERRALRERALGLRETLFQARVSAPACLLLNFSAGAAPAAQAIELLLLRPSAVIVGAIREYRGPIEARPDGLWVYRATGEQIRDRLDQSPLQHIRAQRDAVRARLDQAAEHLGGAELGAHPFERTAGVLICVPQMHPDSRISLDVVEHRQRLKVLGLDELPGLVSMLTTDVRLAPESMRAITTDIFAARLWHDGDNFLFDLAPCAFRLRLLDAGDRAGEVLPLIEGENVIGRRRSPQGHEHRLTLAGDDLVSSDHAWIMCEEGGRVLLRDSSKNGTWVTPPGGAEERVYEERAITAGAVLRMGVTRMRLERADA